MVTVMSILFKHSGEPPAGKGWTKNDRDGGPVGGTYGGGGAGQLCIDKEYGDYAYPIFPVGLWRLH